jgi:hypothetical protein
MCPASGKGWCREQLGDPLSFDRFRSRDVVEPHTLAGSTRSGRHRFLLVWLVIRTFLPQTSADPHQRLTSKAATFSSGSAAKIGNRQFLSVRTSTGGSGYNLVSGVFLIPESNLNREESFCFQSEEQTALAFGLQSIESELRLEIKKIYGCHYPQVSPELPRISHLQVAHA